MTRAAAVKIRNRKLSCSWEKKSCSLRYPQWAELGPPPEFEASHTGRTELGPLPILGAYWRWWGGGWLSQNVKLHRVFMATCTIPNAGSLKCSL